MEQKLPSFAVQISTDGQIPALHLLAETLGPAHVRLKNVYIDNRPWQRVLERADRPEAFIYLDPPYMGYEDYYGSCFAAAEHQELAHALQKSRARFILSLNDCEKARRLYQGFAMHKALVPYTANTNNGKKGSELLIHNYDFDEGLCARLGLTKV